jgi:hypothetical protein
MIKDWVVKNREKNNSKIPQQVPLREQISGLTYNGGAFVLVC